MNVIQGHLAVVEYLCAAKADINTAANDGYTPVCAAAQNVSVSYNVCIYYISIYNIIM